MKKLVIALFVLGVAFPSFAGLKAKAVAGTWSYQIETGYETLTGTLKFEKSGKELTGHVYTEDGQTIPFDKVEIQDNNVVYCELVIEYAPYKVTLTIDDKKFEGTVSTDMGDVPITGAKIE